MVVRNYEPPKILSISEAGYFFLFLDGREVLDVSGDKVGIASEHGNLVEDHIFWIEDFIISL